MIFGSRPFCGAVLLACAVLGGLPLSGGCSYIFVTAPKDDDAYEHGYIVVDPCSTNVAAPVVDSLLATTNLVSSLYVARETNASNKGPAVGLGLAVAALWLSSAIYGFSSTSKCTVLRNEEAFYHQPSRLRTTVLSGSPGRSPLLPPSQPAPPPTQVAPTPSPRQAAPAPPPPPWNGAGGAGGMAVPAAPANAAPAIPAFRQPLD